MGLDHQERRAGGAAWIPGEHVTPARMAQCRVFSVQSSAVLPDQRATIIANGIVPSMYCLPHRLLLSITFNFRLHVPNPAQAELHAASAGLQQQHGANRARQQSLEADNTESQTLHRNLNVTALYGRH